MKMAEKVLPIVFHKQEKGYYCGPATIQMILEFLGTGGLTQDDLWDDVRQNSACAWHGDSEDARLEPLEQTDYLWVTACPCWATSPEALRGTINQHLPATVHLKYAPQAMNGINGLITSIDHNVPPGVTIRGFNHWVVVNGYVMDPPAEPGPGQPYTIQGLYVTDPLQTDATRRHRLVPLRQWKGSYFGSMDCGTHQDEHPIVVGV
jgi:hypothetical protein